MIVEPEKHEIVRVGEGTDERGRTKENFWWVLVALPMALDFHVHQVTNSSKQFSGCACWGTRLYPHFLQRVRKRERLRLSRITCAVWPRWHVLQRKTYHE